MTLFLYIQLLHLALLNLDSLSLLIHYAGTGMLHFEYQFPSIVASPSQFFKRLKYNKTK